MIENLFIIRERMIKGNNMWQPLATIHSIYEVYLIRDTVSLLNSFIGFMDIGNNTQEMIESIHYFKLQLISSFTGSPIVIAILVSMYSASR